MCVDHPWWAPAGRRGQEARGSGWAGLRWARAQQQDLGFSCAEGAVSDRNRRMSEEKHLLDWIDRTAFEVSVRTGRKQDLPSVFSCPQPSSIYAQRNDWSLQEEATPNQTCSLHPPSPAPVPAGIGHLYLQELSSAQRFHKLLSSSFPGSSSRSKAGMHT